MANLNLVPNPSVMAIIGVYFLIVIAIVKRFFISPFLSLKEKREALTSGSEQEAQNIITEVQKKTEELNEQIQDAKKQAEAIKERVLAEASNEKSKLILEAKDQSDQQLNESLSAIKKQLVEEMNKAVEKANTLSQDVYQKLVGG